MKKSIIIFVSIVLATLSATSLASGNAEVGQAKSATCMGCHGLAGNSTMPNFPKLAGQGEGYILKQLQEFKSGARDNAIMGGVASLLSEQDMMDIAAYYSIQTISENSAKADEKTIELARKIYLGGKKDTKTTACIACHGPQGQGIPAAGFPALSSQHAAYVSKQLKLFRQDSINAQTGVNNPSRTNDYEGMMINFTKSLTNAEIDAVSEYIAGLH